MDHSELDRTAKAIEALELKKAHLLREASAVDRELRYAKSAHGKLLNEQAPIFKLPTEILSDIFMMCQKTPAPRAMQLPFEVLASHVCSAWRQVAVGTALLWITIVVKVRTRHIAKKVLEWQLARVSAYLARSATCPFTTSFDIVGPFQVDQVLDLISAHADRWLRLSISVKNPPAATLQIWQSLHSVYAPVLEHVSIWLTKLSLGGHHLNEMEGTPLIFRGGAPSLKFVRVSGMALGCLQPPLGLVETLHLSGHPLSYASFRTMLDGIPNLLNLSLHRMHITFRPGDRDCPPIVLPRLRSLRVCGNTDDEEVFTVPAHRILLAFSAPALESIVLKDLDAFDEQTFPTVHTLALHTCPLSAGEMFRMLRAFPALTTFRLDESLPDILDLLGMPDGASGKPPWPKLSTLHLTDMESADVELLCEMISRRKTLGAPLERVFLDRRSRVVLRKKDRLDFLSKAVDVDRHEGLYAWPSDLRYADNEDGFCFD
ncbi:hypothetical protein FB45DRAFT_820088 [Roridomyces roridus]|uniref:F-box domain-containing protein n=1 Tax=Roridomyces roridus TaxID=1738132 RepID=A0AAD7CMG0_9AGAR|nr:hypothetical protein FB45DRAFT_820088 [Roridomyces roridus]